VSIRNSVRSLPALLRIGFIDALAYRAEMLVWILATTMPLIMLSLWMAVARDAPVGRFGQPELIAYFLATFIVRQLTGSWASWEMNMDVRSGTLAMRLLRPVHPLFAYAAENIAAIPLRAAVSIPVAVIALVLVGTAPLPRDATTWIMWSASMLGAWLITLLVNFAIGSLAFFVESSVKVMDIWLAVFFVFSGYLLPVELFPPAVRAVGDWLPFRYQIGLPVEIMTGAHTHAATLALLMRQWAWIVALFVATAVLWRRGLARFAAYGG
jgi:ABC-2 type transport system permease protein